MLPRGLRNNNPGNIDFHPKINWIGQEGIETGVPNPRFVKFKTMAHGVRAICRLLQTYKLKYNIDTLREIAHRYAPTVENKTDRYIENISKWSGIDPDYQIDSKDPIVLERVVGAIIRQENGRSISQEDLVSGIKMACK